LAFHGSCYGDERWSSPHHALQHLSSTGPCDETPKIGREVFHGDMYGRALSARFTCLRTANPDNYFFLCQIKDMNRQARELLVK
jgi:hypothetical protein